MKWSAVREYVQVLRALLRGEEATWESRVMRMMHPAGYGASRPIEVPILIGAAGPKGIATGARSRRRRVGRIADSRLQVE